MMTLTCLNEGAALDAVAVPFSPPWVCATCHTGWWNSELTDAARAAWRTDFQDFGALTAAIAAAVAVEQVG